jgi:transposase
LSSFVSDLLGLSAQRMLKALAEGETNPTALAALVDKQLRATPEQLCDALSACTDLKPVYRRLLKMALEQLQLLEQQIGQLDQEMANLLDQHQDAVEWLAEVPGLGVDSAQIIAEVGPTAATFPSEKCLSSWVGACPGDDESAGVNYSRRSPKGNRHMRRLLNQAANAAARTKGSVIEIVYHRAVPRLGHSQTATPKPRLSDRRYASEERTWRTRSKREEVGNERKRHAWENSTATEPCRSRAIG